jgi:hypothetical protein
VTKNLTVELEGGCGNQLFQFFAGLYVAQKTGKHLNVDTHRVVSNRHGGHCISDSKYFSTLPQVSFNLEVGMHEARRMIGKIFRKAFQADGIGLPENLASMDQAQLIKGYFQTYFFFEQLAKNGSVDRAGLVENLLGEVKSKISGDIDFSKSTIIHIRAGDYRSQKQAIGMLSTSYYSAVNQRLSIPTSKTYIISDESSSSISNRIGKTFQYEYIDPSKLHPLEMVALISQFVNIGLSNSTLSWWGAFLQKSGRVVAPEKWFFSLESPRLLIPSHWDLERSVWEE